MIAGSIVLVGIGIWFVASRTSSRSPDGTIALPTPTPFQTVRDIGFSTIPDITPPSEISFEDPISVPAKLKVFRILPGVEELFSSAGMVAVAKGFGFTGNASVLPTGDGYTYYESDMKLTLSPNQGIASFSRDINSFQPQRDTITPSNATDIARNFAVRVGFDNPLYIWQQAEVTPYEIHGPGQFEEVTSIQEKGFYLVAPRIQLLNLPVILTQKVVIRIGSDGTVLGAYLWYPNLDMEGAQEWDIIDYPTATVRARNNQGVYWRDDGLNLTGDTMTFNTSELVFFVPNEFISGATSTEHHLIPAYRFGNNRAHLYVSALP